MTTRNVTFWDYVLKWALAGLIINVISVNVCSFSRFSPRYDVICFDCLDYAWKFYGLNFIATNNWVYIYKRMILSYAFFETQNLYFNIIQIHTYDISTDSISIIYYINENISYHKVECYVMLDRRLALLATG